MVIVETVLELRALVERERKENKKVGLVATMGNLHEGHIALVHVAKQSVDFIVATIFVNPLQFGPAEDLAQYPRTPEADQEKLADAGCHVLFMPSVTEMYPEGLQAQTIVSVPQVTEGLCGAARPGHFDGMATVVNKMFNIVQPDVAVFGEKDYQQLTVIRSMVRNLNIPISIVGAPTVRASDGLALSSRNGYLNQQERAVAPILYQCLREMAESIQEGFFHDDRSLDEYCQRITSAGLQVEYLEVRNALDLSIVTDKDERLVVLLAARLGRTRLIDNVVVQLGGESQR